MLFVDAFELDRQEASEMMREAVQSLHRHWDSTERLQAEFEQRLNTWLSSSPAVMLMPVCEMAAMLPGKEKLHGV